MNESLTESRGTPWSRLKASMSSKVQPRGNPPRDSSRCPVADGSTVGYECRFPQITVAASEFGCCTPMVAVPVEEH